MKKLIHKHCWRVYTDPFYPETTSAGISLDPVSYERALNPQVDPATLSIFFDVYDWTNSFLISGISPEDGLSRFPDARTLPLDAPLMVIISGAQQTGLDSLANLVAYKAQKVSRKKTILCDVVLDGRDAVKNVQTVAENMIAAVEFRDLGSDAQAAMAEKMRQRLDRAVDARKSTGNVAYGEVFKTFGMIIEPLRREVLFKISQGGPDSWGRIYYDVRACAACIIVTTPDASAAKTCYQSLTTQGSKANVCWIRAEHLDRPKAHEYVAARLTDVRTAPGPFQPPLLPFSYDAIDVLFEPGSAAPRDGVVKHPVGWIRQSLAKAIANWLEAFQKAHHGADAATLAALPLEAVTIDAETVARARDDLNRGKF